MGLSTAQRGTVLGQQRQGARRRPRRSVRLVRIWCAVVSVGLAVVAAACSGPTAPSMSGTGNPEASGSASAGSFGSSAASSPINFAAYVGCMHRHGEPNMPYPTVSRDGGHVSVNLSVSPGSGFNPRTPRFMAASKACRHLLPKGSGLPPATAITPGDRTDYLKAARCMRAHGFAAFPDPVFQNGGVTFNVPKSIDTRSPRFLGAIAACERLIPAGLPYSSPGDP